MSEAHRELNILIVEDDPVMGPYIIAEVSALRTKYPDATLTLVRTKESALRIVRDNFPPDAVLLDLTLEDSGFEETLASVDEIDERSAVVIITGHSRDRIKPMLRNSQIEIITKKPDTINGSTLIRALCRALLRKNDATQRIKDNITKLREFIDSRPTPSPDGTT